MIQTKHFTRLAVLVAVLLTTIWAYAAPPEQTVNAGKTDTGKSTTIDLRSKTKQMKLKDGANLVYSGRGFKLTAIARGGKVARWTATDNNGNSLPTTVNAGVVQCEVCVTIQTGGGGYTKTCTVVDCSILEKGNTTTKAQ